MHSHSHGSYTSSFFVLASSNGAVQTAHERAFPAFELQVTLNLSKFETRHETKKYSLVFICDFNGELKQDLKKLITLPRSTKIVLVERFWYIPTLQRLLGSWNGILSLNRPRFLSHWQYM